MDFCIVCGCNSSDNDCENGRIESDGARRALVAYATKLEEENSDLRLCLQWAIEYIEEYIFVMTPEDMLALKDAKELMKALP